MMMAIPAELASVTARSLSAAGLHPDTSPDAIAADQRAAVAAALAERPGATAEQLSDLTDLPVWTVGRRLRELAGLPPEEALTTPVSVGKSRGGVAAQAARQRRA